MRVKCFHFIGTLNYFEISNVLLYSIGKAVLIGIKHFYNKVV